MRRLLGFVIASLLFISAAYAFDVYGAIGEKWQALGGEGGPFGEARSDEAAAQYGGRFNRFAYGSIYWHPETDAHAVGGSIGEKWAQVGFENYGYPITDESTTPDGIGRYNHFRAVHLPDKPEASIYWTPETGAHAISGGIRQKWAALEWERTLGYPTTDESTTPDGIGRYNHFRAVHLPGKPEASIYWTPETGAHAIYGAIRDKWAQLGWEKSFGYPITDELGTPDGVGRFNHFRHLDNGTEASIYWTPETGAVEIYGAIRQKWAEMGWETGPMGYPTGAEHNQLGGGRVQRFRHGVISWTEEAGAVQRLIGGDVANFDTGRLPSDLALGGSAQLMIHRNGDFLFTTHAHDSGLENIDYGLVTVLISPDGTAFTFEHKGHVEGTSAGLPFGTPNRDSDFSVGGNDPRLAALFDQIVEGGGFTGKLSGVGKLQQALNDLLADAAKQLAAAGIKAVISLI